jgi:AcrR family transcriptional regulator
VHQRILDSTRELICARGPRQITINEIAAHAGVGKQTIYRWWPSKTAVAIEALEQMFEAESPFPDSGSAHDDTRTQMRRVADTFASPTGSIIRELVAESQGDVTIAEEFRVRFFAERRRRARAVLQAGVDRGELCADLDVEVAIDLLYAPLWMRLLVGHQPLTQRCVDAIVDLAWSGLAARAGRKTT